MKNIKSIIISVCLIFSLNLISCDHEDKWSTFEAVGLDIKGIETTFKNHDYFADIPTEGAVFTVKGIGKNKDYAYITRIPDNDGNSLLPKPSDNDFSREYPWGSFKYLNINSPYEIEFTITPNTGIHKRRIEIDFGFGYTISTLRLSQPPMENQTATE